MGFGPMGFGVAGVLGAKLAAPDRPCVAVVGDGAFFMHANVLGTAVEYELPVVWVVWNNYAYASIRGLQRGYLGGRELATDFKHPETGAPYNPDFAAMARSAGVDGVSVDRPADLADAVRAAIASGKPYLIDANIGADKNPGGAGVWESARPRRQRAGDRRALSAELSQAMATANDLRRMALKLEGTTEAPHFDRAAFKVARIYVTLAADGRTANFRLHARRAGTEMPAGAEGVCAGAERLGQAGLDHRHAVRAQRGGPEERARNGVGPRRAEEECRCEEERAPAMIAHGVTGAAPKRRCPVHDRASEVSN